MAVAASIIDSSSTHRVGPAADSTSSARSRAGVARSLAQSTLMPSPISAGWLGMQRTTARPPPSQRSMSALRMPAATETTSGAEACTVSASAGSTRAIICGFTDSTSTCATPATAAFSSLTSPPGSSAASASRRPALGSETAMRSAPKPRASRPRMMAVAILPPPMKPITGSLMFPPVPPPLPRRFLRSVPFGARPENVRAHPHQRSTLQDGRLQVRGHAHRERVQPVAAPVQLLEQPAQTGKGPALGVQPLRRGRDAHQAAQAQPRQPGDPVGQRRELLRRAAALGRLVVDVDLDAHLQRRRLGRTLLAQAPRDLDPLDGVHPVETLGDRPGLVRLDGADEMPGEARFAERLHGSERALQRVLAEMALAGRHHGAHPLQGLALGDGHQRHRGRIAPRTMCDGSDGFIDFPEVFRDSNHVNSRLLRYTSPLGFMVNPIVLTPASKGYAWPSISRSSCRSRLRTRPRTSTCRPACRP